MGCCLVERGSILNNLSFNKLQNMIPVFTEHPSQPRQQSKTEVKETCWWVSHFNLCDTLVLNGVKEKLGLFSFCTYLLLHLTT